MQRICTVRYMLSKTYLFVRPSDCDTRVLYRNGRTNHQPSNAVQYRRSPADFVIPEILVFQYSHSQ